MTVKELAELFGHGQKIIIVNSNDDDYNALCEFVTGKEIRYANCDVKHIFNGVIYHNGKPTNKAYLRLYVDIPDDYNSLDNYLFGDEE